MKQERVRVILPYAPAGDFLFELMTRGENVGKYRLPGGIEPGETPARALTRELYEEFGVPDYKTWHAHYLGRDPRPAYSHEHIFFLPDHGVRPGVYVDAAGDQLITLVARSRKLSHGKYLGPPLGWLIWRNLIHEAGMVGAEEFRRRKFRRRV